VPQLRPNLIATAHKVMSNILIDFRSGSKAALTAGVLDL
jgi:hypothetical protein